MRAEISHPELGDSPFVVALEGIEGLSEPFDIEVQVLLQTPDLDLQALAWTMAGVELFDDDLSADEPLRAFHGVIECASFLGNGADGFTYALRLRPLLHSLAYRFRTRIFQKQNQTIQDIIRRLLDDAGIDNGSVLWADGLELDHRDYCAQWKESELAFVSRLLEEEGLYYWFEPAADQHLLYIGNGKAKAAPIDGGGSLSVGDRSAGTTREQRAYDLGFSSSFAFDSFTTSDWDWMTPQAAVETDAGDPALKYEWFEYPGEFQSVAAARRRAGARLIDLDRCEAVLTGKSNHPGILPGRAFDLLGAHVGFPESFLVVRARHSFRAAQADSDLPDGYEVSFSAIPSSVRFVPPLKTPRPRIIGKELAVVTGPAGEEIHVDEWGRIKVHFYWDREDAVDDKASCWLRVQQQNTFGSMILPRIGWEVDVGFVDGDPDRPLAMQKLYNAENMPPYTLPDNLMQTALQTSSTPGGGGTNEVRMNDSNGQMELFVHAQKDLAMEVGNDLTEQVTANASSQTTGSSVHKVTGTETISITANQSVNVKGTCTYDNAHHKKLLVGATESVSVTGMYGVTTGGARSDSVGGLKNVLTKNTNETFNADAVMTVGGALCLSAGGPIIDAVAKRKTETVGGVKIELIAKSKAENIKLGKLLNTGEATFKTGGAIGYSAKAALAIHVGGPIVIKCGKDFNVGGDSVTITVGEATLKAGGNIHLTGGGVEIKGDNIDTSGQSIALDGTVEYKAAQ